MNCHIADKHVLEMTLSDERYIADSQIKSPLAAIFQEHSCDPSTLTLLKYIINFLFIQMKYTKSVISRVLVIALLSLLSTFASVTHAGDTEETDALFARLLDYARIAEATYDGKQAVE